MKLGPITLVVLILTGLSLGLVIAGLPTWITLLMIGGIFIFYLAFIYPLVIISILLALVPFNILWMGAGVTPLGLGYCFTFVILLVCWGYKRILKGLSGDPNDKFVPPVLLSAILIYCVAALALLLAILRGHKLEYWGSDLNALMYYGLCFILLDTAKDKKGIYAIFLLLVFSTFLGFLKGLYLVASRSSQVQDVVSIQHVTLSYTSVMGLFMLIICTAVAVTNSNARKKTVFGATAFFFALMIALSFARSLWISAIFGLALLFLILTAGQKNKFIKMLRMLVLASSLYIGIAMSLPSKSPLAGSIFLLGKRVESIFTAKEEPSIMTRESEWLAARKKALEYPFFGNGLGTPITYFRYDNWMGGETWNTTRYVHNAYLSIILNMGLLGLCVFLWFGWLLITYGLRLYSELPGEMDRALALGVSCAFGALMVASLAGPFLTAPSMTIWVGFFTGFLIILDKFKKVT